MPETTVWEAIQKRASNATCANDYRDLYLVTSTKFMESVTYQMLVARRQEIIILKSKLQHAISSVLGASLIAKPYYLLKALWVIKKFPEPTLETTVDTNVHTLLEIIDRFFKYDTNRGRWSLFRAIFKIFLLEIAHDIFYVFRFDWFIEQIIQAIFEGKWKPRDDIELDALYWSEPKPWGGTHSIVYKLWKHRDEIKKIIEGD